MPDGSSHRLSSRAVPSASAAPDGTRRRYALAASLAMMLHAAAVLPLVWPGNRATPPSVVEAVEIAPVPEPVASQAAEVESFAEAVAAAPPEPAQATEPPPEPVNALPPPESMTPPRPEPIQTSSPELVPPPLPGTLRAEAPPLEPVPAEELVAAALPLPPPVPPPRQVRVAPPPRPAPRPAQQALPRAAPVEAPSEAAAPALPAPTARRPPSSYVGLLLAALDRHKEYPYTARWRRAEGIALLRFSMRRDGTVASWRLERSTGQTDLDAAVEQMIRRASPLPAPPNDLPGDPVELVVPVRFSLR